MITLTLPPLKAGSPFCYHHYIDTIENYLMECIYCDKQLTTKEWGLS
jgi:hypothetical protein